jgi:hypothetical protein
MIESVGIERVGADDGLLGPIVVERRAGRP